MCVLEYISNNINWLVSCLGNIFKVIHLVNFQNYKFCKYRFIVVEHILFYSYWLNE